MDNREYDSGNYGMRMHIVIAADEIAKTREYDDTRIMDICMAANISRQTLYNYFRDKLDMLFWERSELMNDFFYRQSSLCGWNEALALALKIDSHANNLLQRITASKDNARFMELCEDLYCSIFRKELKARGIVETDQYSFYIHYGAVVLCRCLDDWYRSGRAMDVDTLIKWLDDMTPPFMRSMRELPVKWEMKQPV